MVSLISRGVRSTVKEPPRPASPTTSSIATVLNGKLARAPFATPASPLAR